MKTDRNILRKCAIMLALIVSGAFLLEACAKEPSPLEEAGRITMTTKASEVIIYVTGAENITIDWGDGKKSNAKDAFSENNSFTFSHNYSGTTAYNIVITGNIKGLSCSDNQLTALDVSRSTTLINLFCNRNQLTSLDISRNTALTQLECIENRLTSLDMSRNTALIDLNCSRNQLTALDVSRNTALHGLDCNYNKITKLDVSKNTVLWQLCCVDNQLTTTALNDLFRTLPYYPGLESGKYGAIFIAKRNTRAIGNPGILECDRSIAEKRGWIFMTER
jgi:hypothetical protein